MLQPVLQAWHWLQAHPYILAIILLTVTLIVAFVVDYLFGRVLKGLVRRSKTIIDDHILDHLHGPMRSSVLLLAMLVALDIFLEEQTWRGTLVDVIYSVIVIVWTIYLARMSRTIFRALRERHRTEHSSRQLLPLIDNLILLLLLAHGGYWIFHIWDINVTPLLASAGIATAALALASKDTLANLFGGVSVLMDHPFSLGDYITLGNGQRGEVVDIGIRSTRILTRDDVLITVPNSIMSTTTIINESGRVPRYRVRVSVGVGYGSDPDQVEAVLLKACDDLSEILPSPKPRVRFREFGDSALHYQLLAWIHDPGDQGRLIHELNTKILKLFRQEGIEIPFPQRVVSYHPQGRQLQAKVEVAGEEKE
jgi:MscS family membrane protein